MLGEGGIRVILDETSGTFTGLPQVTPTVKNLAESSRMKEIWIRSLGREDPLEKEMATHSNILAWRIPRTEKPDGLYSIGLHKVRHD